MHADTLRTILLVKSVEDHDPDGAILPPAEREAATRVALRAVPAIDDGAEAGHERRTWRVLALRAETLLDRLARRHPVVARTLLLESRASQASVFVLLAAFAIGAALSLLDSRVRIEILAFPLLGLVLWNLVTYVALALFALRRRRSGAGAGAGSGRAPWVAWPARWGWRRAAAMIRESAFYHRPLAGALRGFSDEWWPHAQPLLVRQGRRLFHAAAAVVALGLVAGFYVRGIALEYRAGWESTFLGPAQVQALLHVLYGPASAITGIALPDATGIATLHWRGGEGGGPAAPWIHLMAVTAILYVVLPRLLLAAVAWAGLVAAARRLEPPQALRDYARAAIGSGDGVMAARAIRVVPYAAEPSPAIVAGLERLLHAAWGPDARIDWTAPVPYGDEDRYATLARPAADFEVLLHALASTPEVENHGALLLLAREAQERGDDAARRIVLVDESALRAALRGDERRLDERRGTWRDFVTRHGVGAVFADLAAAPDEAVVRQLRLPVRA